MERIESLFFWLALAAYVASSGLYIYYLISKKSSVATSAKWLAIGGFLIHTGSLGARWSLAGHMPMSNWLEFLSAFSWALVLLYITVENTSKIKSIGAFVMPLPWMLMLAATLKWQPPQALMPALQSIWFYFHIISAFISYASFGIAFGIAVIYLLQERNMKYKHTGLLFRRLPPLEKLDDLSYKIIIFAFPLLTIAIITGAIWAEEAWGRYWGWDPKETASLVTWLIFASYLHARITAGWRGKRAAWLSSIGFVMVLFTFFGINYFSKLHGYA